MLGVAGGLTAAVSILTVDSAVFSLCSHPLAVPLWCLSLLVWAFEAFDDALVVGAFAGAFACLEEDGLCGLVVFSVRAKKRYNRPMRLIARSRNLKESFV